MATYYNNLWLAQAKSQAKDVGLQIVRGTGLLDNVTYEVSKIGQPDNVMFITVHVLALQGFIIGYTEGLKG
ncbi:hypothetical protein SIPHO082v1_p0140 [Vibrio phage 294E48.1]|nr:hypothetical protein SIPHO082v1_p0140 [Vibrio phage 294E48.1]